MNTTFEAVAKTHEKYAADLEACIPKMPPSSKAAILREVAHHLECAARMRGSALLPLSIAKQRSLARERWR